MAGEVGNAYVSVVPKVDGNPEAVGSQIGSGLSSGAKGTFAAGAVALGNILSNALTSVASSIGEQVGKTFWNYADYEQLVGGVQKLYGNMGLSIEEYAAQNGKSVDEIRDEWQRLEDAQNLVLENASQAYRTSGMSMNEYMEAATNFSASLINSLGGDTREAAELTDIAMQNISDNFNTFGGDIGMIQGAFQGFAKQNYTMLDNLKLGYGGTKTEMERLIADANEYAESIGESGNLTINSFADIIRAIDLVQRKQQIRGTTAREAEKTIQGSLGMTKAAFQDLLTAMGGGGDVDQAFDNFITSFQTTVDNIIPVLERIIPAIGQIIEKITPLVEEYLPVLIEEVSPLVVDAITIIGGAILDLLGELLPKLGEFLLEKLTELGMWIVENDPFIQSWLLFSELAIEAITALIDWVVEIVNVTWAKIQEIWNFVTPYFTAIWETIKAIFSPVVEWFEEHWRDAWNAIKTIWDVVVDFFDNIWESIKLIFSVVQDVLSGDFQGAWNGIKEIINLWADYFQGIWDDIKGIFEVVADWFGEKFQAAWDAITAIFEPVIDFFQGIWDSITGVFDGIGDTISGYFDLDWASVGSNIINGIAGGVTNAGAALWNAISNAVSYAWNNLLAWLGIASPSKKARDQIGKMWAAGIGLGFEQGMPVDDMVGAVSDAFDEIEDAGMPNFDYDNIDISTLDTGGAYGSSYADNGVVINVYATERQDEEEVAREVQRVFVQWENQRKAAYA